MTLEEPILGLTAALRRERVPVGVEAVCDALSAVAAVDVSDRIAVRMALAATLVKHRMHRDVFDRLFDVYLPASVDSSAAHGDSRAPDGLRRRGGVPRPGRSERPDGRPYGERRAPRSTVSTPVAHAGDDSDRDGVGVAAGHDDLLARLSGVRPAEVSSPASGLVALLRRVGGFDLLALAADDVELGRIVRKLAPLLATQPTVRHRSGHAGRLDMRRTIRRSLSTGGALADPVLRPKRPHRPRLVVLCDVSGSMGGAAPLTLLLSHALQRSFTSVRSFVFIDMMAEVTDSLGGADLSGGLAFVADHLHAAGSGAVSDYGAAFGSLIDRHAGAIGTRTVVLVFGDARSNYRPLNVPAVRQLRRRARRVLWLNPEPRAYWGSGDSAADVYADHCEEMIETRTVAQLATSLSRIGAM